MKKEQSSTSGDKFPLPKEFFKQFKNQEEFKSFFK
jgi:hypothetical protein